jgi:hypothetical protein
MSYRKPAPKYIPSPPPSPFSSPTSTFNRMSISPGSPVVEETPPLPEDWREVIRLAMAANVSTGSVAISTAGVADIAIPLSPVLDVSRKEQVFPTIVVDRSYSRDSLSPGENPARSPTTGKTRKLHRSYRPPTPPTQAHYKRRRLPDDDSGFSGPMMPCRMVYPDLPWQHDSQDAYRMSSMPSLSPSRRPSESTRRDSFSTLTTSHIPSVKTECLNSNTADPEASPTWPGDLSTFDDGNTLNLPVPKDHAGGLVTQFGGAGVEERSPDLYNFLRRASAWVKARLGSFSVSVSFC